MDSIRDKATDPQQYDHGEVLWSQEGSGLNHVRRMFLERLSPYLDEIANKNILDLGCGQGWLSAEMAKRGAHVVGIDPSQKNIDAAVSNHPGIDFRRIALGELLSDNQFDIVTALMVFEHLPSLDDAYSKIKSLLKPKGKLIAITGDFEKFTKPRFGYSVEVEHLDSEEIATRTDYGERSGVIYDINRTAKRFIDRSEVAGFRLLSQEAITAPDWLIAERPQYGENADRPLFHLFEFELL